MRYIDIEYIFYLGLVEHRIWRSCDWRWKLTAVAWIDAAVCVACYGCNLNGKVVP